MVGDPEEDWVQGDFDDPWNPTDVVRNIGMWKPTTDGGLEELDIDFPEDEGDVNIDYPEEEVMPAPVVTRLGRKSQPPAPFQPIPRPVRHRAGWVQK